MNSYIKDSYNAMEGLGMSVKVKRNIIHSYKCHGSMKEYMCFYCGGHGESKDHVPPISYPDNVEEESRLLVRCCLLCNSLLGKKYYITLLSRCEYLLIQYRKRFKRILSLPVWKKEEIDELASSFKWSLIRTLKKKEHIEKKILFIQNNITIILGY